MFAELEEEKIGYLAQEIDNVQGEDS